MRKMLQLQRSALVLTLFGLTGCLSSDKSNPGQAHGRTRMSDETAAFIRDRKIPLKSTDAEFYGNKEEQVYLLNSQERIKLGSKKSVKNTVAVVNHKQANGKSAFYLIEQEITAKQIRFVLRRDSKVLESLPIRLAAAPSPGGNCKEYCDRMDANNRAYLQVLQVEANKYCSTRHACLPMCHCVGGYGTVGGSALYAIYPTSVRCGILVTERFGAPGFWTRRNPSPFLDQAFDTAIKKEAKLYVY